MNVNQLDESTQVVVVNDKSLLAMDESIGQRGARSSASKYGRVGK
ncbi:MAG: hypothetical protein ABR928_07085 [Terracidiphilus sp.]